MSGVGDDPAVSLLERLLALSERSPDRTRAASTSPNYDQMRTADSIARFSKRLAAAENAGAITIDQGKRERRHLIDRVRVKDTVALARHLGRTPATETAQRLDESLTPLAAQGEPWVMELLKGMVERWSKGDSVHRLSPSDIGEARDFVGLIAAVSKDICRGLDGRTFSLKVTGDSKSFDRHANRIAAVMASYWGTPALQTEEVWARLGLERFAHPIHVRGSLVARSARGVLVDCRAKPFASIHPEYLPLLELTADPTALVTIENYTSFNRQAREIEDGTLLVYLGGFPSSGTLALLKWLASRLDLKIPFYHWGDIDVGGVKIFRFLEEGLSRPLHPHLMSRTLAETHGKPARRESTLGLIAKSNSALSLLADWLANGEEVRHLEQEALDPVSPLNRSS